MKGSLKLLLNNPIKFLKVIIQNKQRKLNIIIIVFSFTVSFLFFGYYRGIATDLISLSLKQSHNQQVCRKYKNISRELEPVSNQLLSSSEILFKTKSANQVLSLPTEPLPKIHQAALKAKLPVMMYHDILSKKSVIYDLTPQELKKHFELIKSNKMTPISLNRLIAHLRTGSPLPKKPILLTFDDGYGGHYEYAYPLLKKYGYPAVFAIHTSSVGVNANRTHVTWQQLRTMASDPLITISSHSKTHPALTKISDKQLKSEVMESKQILEAQLNQPIIYFTYPYGNYDARVKKIVEQAGYLAAIAFTDPTEMFAGQSKDLLAIARFEKSRLEKVIPQAWGNASLPQCND
jgi:peptidoglycan/xylan/chitin deacetylase (PgdA/CDA1 family)